MLPAARPAPGHGLKGTIDVGSPEATSAVVSDDGTFEAGVSPDTGASDDAPDKISD